MGLFSSKKKHFVDTSVSRVVDDEKLPTTAKSATLMAILEEGDIADKLLDSLKESSVFDFDRMYRYGRDEYYYGLPNSQRSSSSGNQVKPAIQSVLDAMVGQEVTVDYAAMGTMDYTHATYQLLTDQYDYSAVTNEIEALSQQKGTTVWLVDVVPVYDLQTLEEADSGTLTPIGFPATSGYTPDRKAQAGALGRFRQQTKPLYSGELDFEVTIVQYMWIDGAGKKHYDEMTFAMEFDDITADYFMARFSYSDSLGEDHIGFMSYERGEGSFPILDNLYNYSYVEPGTYFPFVFFRSNDQNRTAEKYHDTEAYQTTSKLVEKIGMDFQEVGDTIHENKDVGDIEQGVMVMAVPAKSDDPIELEYLYQFWNRLAVQQESSSQYNNNLPFNSYDASRVTTSDKELLNIYDADFSMKIRWRNINSYLRAGTLGPVGTVVQEKTTLSMQESYTKRAYDHSTGEYGFVDLPRNFQVEGFVIRKQITESVYQEIVVGDPSLYYYVGKGKGITADFDDERFLIPIDRDLTLGMPTLGREILYLRSLHFVFNSLVTKRVKWYQSGIFKAILIVIAIVITFFSSGQGAPLIALAAAGAYYTLAYVIIVAVVKMYIMQQGLKLVAKELGAEFAIIAAVVLAMYGGYQAYSYGSVSGAPFASELLAASNGLFSAAENQIVEDINDIVGELADLTEEYEEKMDELQAIEEDLNFQSLIDPLAFVGQVPKTILGEAPTDFYDRTVHSGNIGTLAFDMIHNHVELGIRLPEFDDTIRGFS